MKILTRAFLAGIFLSTVLTGCGTTPASNYYLLSSGSLRAPTGSIPSLGVGPIAIPGYLNRNAFIYSRDGNKLHIANFERWAEPLDDGILRVIRINLAALLDTQNVQGYPWSGSGRPEYGVEVTVLILDANDTQARLVAEWHIYRPKSNETMMRKMSELQQAMPSGPITAIDVEPAYSKLFFKLSEVIAAAISDDTKSRGTK